MCMQPNIVFNVSQALDRIPLIRAIINLIMDIIRDRVAQWIIERGGWVSFFALFSVCMFLFMSVCSNEVLFLLLLLHRCCEHLTKGDCIEHYLRTTFVDHLSVLCTCLKWWYFLESPHPHPHPTTRNVRDS